jgi:hypothetical protein
MRITQSNPNQFVLESDHELESYFSQVNHFHFAGNSYLLDGQPVAIQGTDPELPFAYAVNVTPAAHLV